MIFSSFRESVQEIAGMLNRHTPLIRVMTFMGQASAGKGVKGFTQKEQLEVEVTVAQRVCQATRLSERAVRNVCVTELASPLSHLHRYMIIPRESNK